MKKLLTLAVVFATAGLAHAATLNWSAMTIYQPKQNASDPNVALSGGLAYLFVTSQTEATGTFGATTTTVADVKNLIESGAEFYTDTEGKKYLKKGDDKIQIAAVGATTSTGMLSGNTGYYGAFGAGDALSGFAVVFDAATLTTAKNYIVTDTKSASWTSSTGAKSLIFGGQANNPWTPVPEPSTAVLTLAGLALLLKRRRA